MSNEIVIPFSTRALDAAKLRAKEILGLAKEAAKTISDKLDRRNFLAEARLTAKASVEQAKSSLNLRGQSFRALRNRDPLGSVGGVPPVFLRSGRRTLNTIGALLGDQGGSVNVGLGRIGAAASVAASSGVPGLAQAGQLVQFAVQVMDARIRSEIRAAARAMELRFERRLKEADTRSRLENDPAFRREQEDLARDQFLRSKRRQKLGWHPASSRVFQAL